MHHLWSCVYLAPGVAGSATRHISWHLPFCSHAFARGFRFVADLRPLGRRRRDLVLQYFFPHRSINHYFRRVSPRKDSSHRSDSSRGCARCPCVVAHPSPGYACWSCCYCHQRKFNHSAIDSRHSNREPSRHLDIELLAHHCQLLVVVVVRLLCQRPHGVGAELLRYSCFCVHHRESSPLAICQP